MGPEAKVSGLPAVKYVANVPPIDGWTEEVFGSKVMVPVVGDGNVKESLPKAPKKPVMESACATATLLTARTESIRKRLIMGFSWGLEEVGEREILSPIYEQVQSHLKG